MEEIENLLLKHGRLRSFSKGTILQRQGDTVIKAFYVRKGLLRSYTIDNKGKEHIFLFGPEEWIVADTESYTSKKSAELYIDAIENTEVIEMDQALLNRMGIPEELREEEIDRLIRRIGVLQKRIIMLMSATALERYQDFIETYPNIIDRVPQKMIASYLGITPEALSSIKSNFLKNRH